MKTYLALPETPAADIDSAGKDPVDIQHSIVWHDCLGQRDLKCVLSTLSNTFKEQLHRRSKQSLRTLIVPFSISQVPYVSYCFVGFFWSCYNFAFCKICFCFLSVSDNLLWTWLWVLGSFFYKIWHSFPNCCSISYQNEPFNFLQQNCESQHFATHLMIVIFLFKSIIIIFIFNVKWVIRIVNKIFVVWFCFSFLAKWNLRYHNILQCIARHTHFLWWYFAVALV